MEIDDKVKVRIVEMICLQLHMYENHYKGVTLEPARDMWEKYEREAMQRYNTEPLFHTCVMTIASGVFYACENQEKFD